MLICLQPAFEAALVRKWDDAPLKYVVPIVLRNGGEKKLSRCWIKYATDAKAQNRVHILYSNIEALGRAGHPPW